MGMKNLHLHKMTDLHIQKMAMKKWHEMHNNLSHASVENAPDGVTKMGKISHRS